MSIQGNCVRTLTPAGDWTYGNNLSGYLINNDAIGQQIRCRLLQFLGECFWDTQAGINWIGYLGGKNAVGLNLAISTVVLNTQGVLGINTLDFNVDPDTRLFSVNWNVTTVFSRYFPGTSTLDLQVA